ncbi:PTS sugar transporter subunit IIC [Streptococcus macacae]|uniref:Membrane protein n=1 Tax=Streptococcus macacae NCTC 11558 TaxID=764298 RepID=G5JTZ9_9STRE|nr:PTS sugar transporter subunit IIC [Streptococcus macacae]EHJ52356.1 putative membrane protein [Streptococcus macacae NCTC 11558]SUN78367.1 component of a phospotransferase system [Streptococcus macacae NCTC 11558]
MDQYLIKKMIAFRKKSFIQISQETLVSLFPFFLLTTFAMVFSESVFSENGYINNLFSIRSWFPYFRGTGLALTNFTALTGGLAGPLTSYFSAKYTAGHYGRSTGTAGITAFVFSLLINSRDLFTRSLNDGDLTRINLPVNINLVVAILIGYAVGQIFRFSSSSDDRIVDAHYIYHPKSVRPIVQSLALAVLGSFLVYLGNTYNVFSTIGNFFSSLIVNRNNLWVILSNSFLRTFGAWIGNSNPFNDIPFVNDSYALDNLNYALKHHTTAGVPYLFSETNLYDAYGTFAGLGGSLALLIAILWRSRSTKDRDVGIKSIFPALFNHGVAFMVGIPVFFNFLFLIPFVLIPVVNSLIAGIMLYFRVMPPAVYPVPSGTPSVLYAFIGTGGSLRALAVGGLIFVVDVLIYLPFVKFNDRIHEEINQLDDEKGADHD